MTEREITVVNLLVDQNKAIPDHARCGSGVSCHQVACKECPLNRKAATIGEIRAMDARKVAPVKDDDVPRCPNGAKAIPERLEPSEDPMVKQPSHYQLFEGVEAIEVIARSMTQAMFQGYCLGNILKYRLRAGKKSEMATLEKDMAKAAFYTELYEKHKALCYDAK